MMEADRIAQAERLVQWGSSDERIESITGLALPDILVVRARLATPQRPRRDGYFPGGWSWWRERPAR